MRRIIVGLALFAATALIAAACASNLLAGEATAGGSATAPVSLQAPSQQPKALTILLGPSVTIPEGDSIYCWWHTSAETDDHSIEFGADRSLGRSVRLAKRTQYPNVRLTGLEPGQTYYYRVVSDGVAGETFSFRFPQFQKPFRMALWADNQSGWRIFENNTIPSILRAKPDVLLAVGDLVDDGRRYGDWTEQLYGPARGLLRSTPWFPVRGNHDGESSLSLQMLQLPDTNHWYARTLGPLRLVVLDSNLDYGPGSAQLRWLREEVAGSPWKRARFRMVCSHHLAFTSVWDSPDYDGEALMRSILVPLLEQNGADLIVNGHTHAYEHGERDRSDGGKTHYLTIGGAGGALDRVRVFPWPHIRVSLSRHHVVVADVSSDTMRLEAINSSNGEIMDTLTIEGRSWTGLTRSTRLKEIDELRSVKTQPIPDRVNPVNPVQ